MHLRVAASPPEEPPARSRAVLVLLAVIVRCRIAWRNLVAVVGAVAALVPLLPRRSPCGHRTQVPRPVARVIPLPPRRRASRP